MMRDFLDGLGFGFILQLSVGPVFAAVLHKSLTQGIRHASSMVFGVALVDGLYILVSMLGVSALLQIGIVRSVVGIAGALLLVFFGIRYLVASSSLVPLEHHNPSLFRSFAFGAGLTLTNPLTILFWTGVMGAMLSSHMFSQRSRAVWFALGCIVSTLLLLNVVALAGQLLQRVLSARLALWLNRAVGLALLGFAAKLAVDVLTHG